MSRCGGAILHRNRQHGIESAERHFEQDASAMLTQFVQSFRHSCKGGAFGASPPELVQARLPVQRTIRQALFHRCSGIAVTFRLGDDLGPAVSRRKKGGCP
jgi:hypothetical protein